MTTEQMIEEASLMLKKIRSNHGTYCGGWHDMDNIEFDMCDECQAIKDFIDKKVEPFFSKQLHLIATKSTENERKRIGDIMYRFEDINRESGDLVGGWSWLKNELFNTKEKS